MWNVCPASFPTALFLLRFEPITSELTVLQMHCTVQKDRSLFQILLVSPTYIPASQKCLEKTARHQACLLQKMERNLLTSMPFYLLLFIAWKVAHSQ